MTKFADVVAQQEEQRRQRVLFLPLIRQWHLRAYGEKNGPAMDFLATLLLKGNPIFHRPKHAPTE